MATPVTVSVACLLILGSCGMLLSWGFVTLRRRSEFNYAVGIIFGADPHADTTVGWLDFKFLLGALASIALACVLLWLVTFVYHAEGWARILFWLVGAATLRFAWRTLVKNGVSYHDALRTGPDPEAVIEEMSRVDDMTPWRFSGWYRRITLGFGIALPIFIAGAAILLAVPASNDYYSGIHG